MGTNPNENWWKDIRESEIKISHDEKQKFDIKEKAVAFLNTAEIRNLPPEQFRSLVGRVKMLIQSQDLDVSKLDEKMKGEKETVLKSTVVQVNKLEIDYFVGKYPDFKGLITKFPDRFEEFKKRALLYKELGNFAKNISWMSAWRDEEKGNIKTIQTALATNPDNNFFKSSLVTTKIEGLNNAGGGINYLMMSFDKISYVEYIKRLLNKDQIVEELFGARPSVNLSLDKSQKEMLSRAKIFMDSFLQRNPKFRMSYKKEIDQIYSLIKNGDMSATSKINTLTKEETDLTVDFSTQKGLFDGLRSIGDTTTAGQLGQQEIMANLDKVEIKEVFNSIYQQKLKELRSGEIANKGLLSGFKKIENQKLRAKVEKKYQETIKMLEDDPTSEWFQIKDSPERLQGIRDSIMAFMAFDEAMMETGTKKGDDFMHAYNDMKGLHGVFNFTDENAKMTKEIAIMIGSMVVTAGASALLTTAAGLLRAVQLARIAKVANNANKVSKLAKTANLGTRAIGGISKGLTWTGESVGALKRIPIIGDAALFTVAQTGLSKCFHSPGEMVTDMEDFSNDLMKNTAMFGMFHGAGKITEGIVSKFGIKGAFKQFGILSAGDVGGMYALNLIETGKYNPSPEEWAMIVAQAAGFRFALKGIEAKFPKIHAKINKMIGEGKITGMKKDLLQITTLESQIREVLNSKKSKFSSKERKDIMDKVLEGKYGEIKLNNPEIKRMITEHERLLNSIKENVKKGNITSKKSESSKDGPKVSDESVTHGKKGSELKEIMKEGSSKDVNQILSDGREVFGNKNMKNGEGSTFKQDGKKMNEDRILIDSEKGILVSLDGMGGHAAGDKAASILADAIKRHPNNIETAIREAGAEIKRQNLGSAGTCFTYSKLVEIDGKKFVDFYWAGDTKGLVLGKDGAVKFASKDQSLVQILVDQGHIKPEAAGHHPRRNEIQNFVGKNGLHDTDVGIGHQRIEVKPGDRVLVFSDGIADNLSPTEISKLLSGVKSGESVNQVIINAVKNRKTGDGFSSKPKADDISIGTYVVGDGGSMKTKTSSIKENTIPSPKETSKSVHESIGKTVPKNNEGIIKDQKIQEYHKQIEGIEIEIRKLNSEKTPLENELLAAKIAYEKLQTSNPRRAIKLQEKIELREQHIKSIEDSIKGHEEKIAKINLKIESLHGEKKMLITEKNEYVKSQEVGGEWKDKKAEAYREKEKIISEKIQDISTELRPLIDKKRALLKERRGKKEANKSVKGIDKKIAEIDKKIKPLREERKELKKELNKNKEKFLKTDNLPEIIRGAKKEVDIEIPVEPGRNPKEAVRGFFARNPKLLPIIGASLLVATGGTLWNVFKDKYQGLVVIPAKSDIEEQPQLTGETPVPETPVPSPKLTPEKPVNSKKTENSTNLTPGQIDTNNKKLEERLQKLEEKVSRTEGQTSSAISTLSQENQEKLKAGKAIEVGKYTVTQMKADGRDWYSDDSGMEKKKGVPTETYDNTFELYLKDGQYVLEMNGTGVFKDTTEPMGKDIPSPQTLQKKMEEMMASMQKNGRETFAITHPELYTVAFNLTK